MDQESQEKFKELQTHLSEARNADSRNDIALALQHYVKSARCLNFIYQREKVPMRKEKFKEQLNKIITKAQELKQKLPPDSQPQPKPQPKPTPLPPDPEIERRKQIERERLVRERIERERIERDKQDLIKISILCEKNAITMDQNGNLDMSYKKYVESIEHIIKASKLEIDQGKKKNMESKATKLLIRAEELKKLMVIRKKPKPVVVAKPKPSAGRSRSYSRMRNDSMQKAINAQKKAADYFKSEQFELSSKYFYDSVKFYKEASEFDEDPHTKEKLLEKSRAITAFISMKVTPKVREELGRSVKDVRWYKVKVNAAIELSKDGKEKEKSGKLEDALLSFEVSHKHFKELLLESPPSLVDQSKKFMFAARCKMLEESISSLRKRLGVGNNQVQIQPKPQIGNMDRNPKIPSSDPSRNTSSHHHHQQQQHNHHQQHQQQHQQQQHHHHHHQPEFGGVSSGGPMNDDQLMNALSGVKPPSNIGYDKNEQEKEEQDKEHHFETPPKTNFKKFPPPTDFLSGEEPVHPTFSKPPPRGRGLGSLPPPPNDLDSFDHLPPQNYNNNNIVNHPPSQQQQETFDFPYSQPPPPQTSNNPPVSNELDFLGGNFNNPPPPPSSSSTNPPFSNNNNTIDFLGSIGSGPSSSSSSTNPPVTNEFDIPVRENDEKRSFDGDFGPSHNIILNFPVDEQKKLRKVENKPWEIEEDDDDNDGFVTSLTDTVNSPSIDDKMDDQGVSSFFGGRLDVDDVVKEKREIFGGQEMFDILGQGSVGTVYKGRYNSSEVAIKEIQLTGGGGEEGGLDGPTQLISDDLIEREIREVMRVSHPNVLTILGWTIEERVVLEKKTKVIGLVSEYLDGGSLFGTVEKWKREDQNQDSNNNNNNTMMGENNWVRKRWMMKWNFVNSILIGLNAIHEAGFIHGENCSSQNILVSADGKSIKLSDFGMGRIMEAAKNRADVVCTPKPSPTLYSKRFVPPETLSFEYMGVYTKASDVFSIGVVIYHLVTQQLPYNHLKNELEILEAIQNGEPLRIPENTPPALKSVIVLCTQQKPENRPMINQILKYLEEKKSEFLRNYGV